MPKLDLHSDPDKLIPSGIDKDKALAQAPEIAAEIAKLAYRLYAESRRSLLIVLQGMDTAGKDGTIRHLMSGLNAQSCTVYSFKRPSDTELAHDFLWRVHVCAPPRGHVSIFNRSHYEDVLVVRVHKLVPKEVWEERFEHINRFEELLADSGTRVLKFFLWIDKHEQRKRLEERLEDPDKNWKFEMGDLSERKHWDQYIKAYQDVLRRCDTKHAPWHVIPANKKWYRNHLVSKIVLEALREMDPKVPKPPPGLDKVRVE